MGMEKAIKHGKERRKPYRKSKALDASCRNHKSCPYCYRTRTHFDRKRRAAADKELECTTTNKENVESLEKSSM